MTNFNEQMTYFEEQIQRITALQEGQYWIAMEQEALPLLLEMQQALSEAQAERDALQKRIDRALDADCFEEAFEILAREEKI